MVHDSAANSGAGAVGHVDGAEGIDTAGPVVDHSCAHIGPGEAVVRAKETKIAAVCDRKRAGVGHVDMDLADAEGPGVSETGLDHRALIDEARYAKAGHEGAANDADVEGTAGLVGDGAAVERDRRDLIDRQAVRDRHVPGKTVVRKRHRRGRRTAAQHGVAQAQILDCHGTSIDDKATAASTIQRVDAATAVAPVDG